MNYRTALGATTLGGAVGYNIEWDGHTVTFPPAGDPEGAVSFKPFREGVLRLRRYAVAMFNSAAGRPMRISLPVVLIPLGGPYDRVSVAAPQSVGGDKEVRHIGFLDDKFVRLLERSGRDAICRLAERSGGEIGCTAIIVRDNDYDGLDFDNPGDLKRAYTDIKLDLPSAAEVAGAIEDFGRLRTDHVLDRLRTFETAEIEIGALSVTLEEGVYKQPSTLNVVSDGVHIGWVALGCLFLKDDRQRAAVLDGLNKLGIPAAAPREPRPEAAESPEWDPNEVPNVFVSWAAGGHSFTWVPPADLPTVPIFRRTFAHYNPTTKTLWVEDERLVAPTCLVAARVGLDVVKIGLPQQSWSLWQQVDRSELRDLSYDHHPYKVRELHPRVAELVPKDLFDQQDLERFAPPEGKTGQEPTELLERLTLRRLALFPNHTYLDELGTCRICGRPAGRFRIPICAETLAYCHRCLAIADKGLSDGYLKKRSIPRATVAVRALADHEFGGAAFVEAQLATVHGDPKHPVQARDIDRRLILRIAIVRRQLAWTHILIDVGLAENGVRLSRGTVLKAMDGHMCYSMLEKAVDDFLHEHGIDHVREPLYPFDEQLNPNTRRRADWLLSDDGTFIEMWGMVDDPAYAEKMREKIELAARHQLRLIGITPADTGSLSAIFADWTRK
ncbi:hypothetical protein MHEL_02780 [Mycolicibacterium helvum]|uniref:Uncharacterized protein n=1 Tax=Mycolicibacterium helvum TaxID=1534349 RepID=A0A7I7T1C9_9MYCO|nr:hypothetical protein MHEL_02780 [Mycolicibacterium helvum]